MNLTTTADSVMMFCILASMAIFDAFSTLLSILKKGIFVDQRSLLMKKTNRELKEMLVGVEKISKLNKKQLVDLVGSLVATNYPSKVHKRCYVHDKINH